MTAFALPAKAAGYLRRLLLTYQRSGMAALEQVIARSRYFVREQTSYDNWDGGTYGHDLIFFVPIDLLGSIDLEQETSLRERLREDLNKCAASISREFFNAVSFDPEDENDGEFRRSLSLSMLAQRAPESVSFWKPGEIRLFVSHRDSHKAEARLLAEALAPFGISAFVAHDTIEPMSAWQEEVRKGLDTMEVLLAFVTPDFDESAWTNQEVGFAIGRSIPVIALQLANNPPSGFLASIQAIRGKPENPAHSAEEIYRVLAEKLKNGARLQSALVSSFVQSPNFNETRDRFNHLNRVVTKLTDFELQTVLQGYSENAQLFGSIYLNNEANRLVKFLHRTTGKHYERTTKGDLKERNRFVDELDSEIPF